MELARSPELRHRQCDLSLACTKSPTITAESPRPSTWAWYAKTGRNQRSVLALRRADALTAELDGTGAQCLVRSDEVGGKNITKARWSSGLQQRRGRQNEFTWSARRRQKRNCSIVERPPSTPSVGTGTACTSTPLWGTIWSRFTGRYSDRKEIIDTLISRCSPSLMRHHYLRSQIQSR